MLAVWDWGAFFGEWHQRLGTGPVTALELVPVALALDMPGLPVAVPRQRAKVVQRLLWAMRDLALAGHRIVYHRQEQGRGKWQAVPLDGAERLTANELVIGRLAAAGVDLDDLE